jgi:hypothetical protein
VDTILAVDANRPIFALGPSTDEYRAKYNLGTLSCTCGNILAEDIPLQSIGDIGLRCFQCNEVLSVPSRPLSAPLPMFVKVLPPGEYVVSPHDSFGPLAHVYLSTRNAEDIARAHTPQPPLFPSASRQSIQWLRDVVNSATGNQLEKDIVSTLRARQHGKNAKIEYPLAWAILITEEVLRSDARARDRAALSISYVLAASQLLQRWRGHPDYFLLAKELRDNLYHGLGMLVALQHFTQHHVPIGFGDPWPVSTSSQVVQGEQRRFPDLYVPCDANLMISVEIKAPKSLQWEERLSDVKKLRSVLDKQLRDARGQMISRNGVVVITFFSENRKFFEKVIRCAEELLRRGQVSSHIHHVGLQGIFPPSAGIQPMGLPDGSSLVGIEYIQNPSYRGQRFFRIGRML